MPSWLKDYVPHSLIPLFDWLVQTHVLLGLTLFSAFTFVASAVGVPVFLTRLPTDYFSRRERHKLGLREPPTPRWRLFLHAGKNILGVILILLGIAMLALPGQGLLTLFVGMVLTDVPGKHRLERAIISRPSVFRAINSLRRRAGRPPLERGSWA